MPAFVFFFCGFGFLSAQSVHKPPHIIVLWYKVITNERVLLHFEQKRTSSYSAGWLCFGTWPQRLLAVVPPLAPQQTNIPACYGLTATAQSELQNLADAIAHNADSAHLLMHMLNRREAVDSSQIEGTQTGFDSLLLHN